MTVLFERTGIPKGSYIILYANGGVSDISTYASGTAITVPSSLGSALIVNPNGNCTIYIASSTTRRIGMKGYSNGRTVKNVAESVVTSKTEAFTNCDMIIAYSIGSAVAASFTITDN